VYVSTNDFGDLVLEDLIKIYEAIAIEHDGAIIKLTTM